MYGIKKFVGFPAMNFGRTLVVLFQLLPLVLGDRVCGITKKEINLSGKKRKRRSIQIKVDLYEVCISGIIYCLLFYFPTILTSFFPRHISGISLTRGKKSRKYWPQGFESEANKATYEWWRAKLLIDGFNAACKNIAASFIKVGDESTSAIRFRMPAKGNLPHLSYIFRNPEPLGKDFKTVACYVTGSLLLIGVQRGKEGMNHSKYQKEIGATTDCTKIMMEETKGIGQKSIKGGTKDCFLFYSWFASKNAEEYEMKFGAKLIGTVKKNTKGF